MATEATICASDIIPDSDADIIQRSLVNPGEFEAIYSRYATALHRYGSRRVGATLADDVVSDTFLAAFRTRHRYDPVSSSALPWLYGIASNVIRRHWRTETKQYRILERTGIDPSVADDHAADVAMRVAASATVRRLGGALARLSRKERDVLTLIVWEGLSYEQVAQALDIPTGTVRSRLNRARQRLHETLNSHSGQETT